MRILRNIPPEHEPYTILILQLLVYSDRPLDVQKVVDAIAVDLEARPPDDRMPIPEETTARTAIAMVCLSYMVELGTCLTDDLVWPDTYRERPQPHLPIKQPRPLALYSIQSWLPPYSTDRKDFRSGPRPVMPESDTIRRWRGIVQLYQAARTGNHQQVEELLRAGVPHDVPDARRITPMEEASIRGHVRVVELLLSQGIDVNCRFMEG